MSWLAGGVVYSALYVLVGWLLRDEPAVLSWFRAGALLVPPMAGTAVIVRRRQTWSGCQWLFWATIALGLSLSAIGLTGWAVDELMFKRVTWLAWPAVFALFGGVAPLFALLAQPHHGAREPLAATTAVDIAGLAVVTGFLYSFFVTAPESAAGTMSADSMSLRVVSVLQQALVLAGMVTAMLIARRTPWRDTYRRLALGALVSLATLTLSTLETQVEGYRSGFVYDFAWILPFAFYPWAASLAPSSDEETVAPEAEPARPRPWLIFTAVAMLPFLDFGLRRLTPNDPFSGFRDLSTAVAIISVLPLLVARIAAERAELQRADGTMRLLAQVIEQTQDLILVLTPDGRCRHANEAFCRATGLAPEQLTKLRSHDLMAPQSISAADIESLVNRGGTWRGTVMRTRSDGTTFPVSASVASLLDERGRPTHLVSVERDISEERRLREQLIHSERLSAVGQLVAGVAHEINNPLQSIMGYTELLMASDTPADVRHDLDQIRADAVRAAQIVRHLLSFARRSTLERSMADLNEIVRSTLALRTFELQTASIDVRPHYARELPLIAVNREEIQQIVLNLILNAEYALRSVERRGTITVRTGMTGSSPFVEVADDGPGVPAEVAGRVFEPFYTTKPVGEGTGLGLSVSFGIAKAHGGSLTLEPSSRGACFKLTLPSSSALELSDLSASA